MDKRIVEIDLDALMKKTKSIENKQAKELKIVKQQYNKVVYQNKTLQAERNAYKNILEEIRYKLCYILVSKTGYPKELTDLISDLMSIIDKEK